MKYLICFVYGTCPRREFSIGHCSNVIRILTLRRHWALDRGDGRRIKDVA